MLKFNSDYMEGAHEKILQRLVETAPEQLSGYGNDHYSKEAADKIRALCNKPNANVVFTTGGTQTNQLVISSMLQIGDGVIAVDTGHINVHEAGAIEYTGHKVLPIPHKNGKLVPELLAEYLKPFAPGTDNRHVVSPGMVYISCSTEFGTVYTTDELHRIFSICKEYGLYLFVDGARLGCALTCGATDLTLESLSDNCDVFYIGGTKAGALCGEAIVFPRSNMPRNFLALQKQHGAMLAKGWLNGLQFDTLFTDDLWFDLCRHANKQAAKIKEGLILKGYKTFMDSPTNLQFFIIPNKKIEQLAGKVQLRPDSKYDEDNSVVRLVTSYRTTDEAVNELLALM